MFLLLALALALSRPAVSQQNNPPTSYDSEHPDHHNQTPVPAGSSARIHEETRTSASGQHLGSSDINAAIERFEAAVESRTAGPDNDDKFASDLANKTTQPTLTSDSKEISGTEPGQTTASQASRQVTRKLIRSRYRLRAHKEPSSGSASGGAGGAGQQQQQLTSAMSNYSQPFDLNAQQLQLPQQQQQQQPPTGNDMNHYDHRHQHHHHHQLARALSPLSAAPTSPDSAAAPYTYLAGPPQRVPSDGTNGAGSSSSGEPLAAVADYSGQSLLADNGATPAMNSYNSPPLAASGRMYPMGPSQAGLSHHRLRAFGANSPADLPYYLTAAASAQAPTTTTTAAASSTTAHGDYFPASGHSQSPSAGFQSSYHPAAESQYDHYVPRNYSENQLDFASTGHHLSPPMLDYWPSPAAAHRSRWSWPWTDVSSLGYLGGGGGGGVTGSHTDFANLGPMSTAATFKKHHHHHHHHLPQHHKEHEHHHEEHLMPKWEHAISFGEIACIAVAVVLGIIILGSPFFLLFLMLFNGGNLFGATQMGLLAPATVQGAATTAAGRRRRRKRSPEVDAKQAANGLKAADLVNMGEHLFERLSPFMDADKLLRSFERMMNVKEDIEKIVKKLGLHEGHHLMEQMWTQKASQDRKANLQQHVEMRRRRKK